jgi:hypothetical protein
MMIFLNALPRQNLTRNTEAHYFQRRLESHEKWAARRRVLRLRVFVFGRRKLSRASRQTALSTQHAAHP